ncbi:hypothetical protein DFJ73DRAFT_861745 [Zopfochytrium polystomum]|nr:hypothetical protein DFJ73DRAFT_861745 [Zopfochytrium polystomum]
MREPHDGRVLALVAIVICGGGDPCHLDGDVVVRRDGTVPGDDAEARRVGRFQVAPRGIEEVDVLENEDRFWRCVCWIH